ncbi:ATP-binding protein [Sphaerisporangium aureirubrum]|uniref:ATP-binding protein n=1 Tax=Sphaerisporangium aureirubrum TaxID=1544736 RepID=A0ABW1NCC5_9ACTN
MRGEQPAPKQSPQHLRGHARLREAAPARPAERPDVPRQGDLVCPEWPLRYAGTFRVLVTRLSAGSASRAARAAVREALAATGVTAECTGEAEVIVAELAANAEKHAPGPYELRVHCLSGIPMWCEMVDGGEKPGAVASLLARLQRADGPDPLELMSEGGRGLLLAHLLSGGRCCAYPTTLSTGGIGQAVAFALPSAVSPV